ncbi:tyrosine-type recombinase/integrase [Limibacillus halophilus]|uniref:Integrase n=1 Tax=Limibacillus halophilus TaxID=1579333 RepID=A0A839SYA3_9PROT|nr:site-specific integrase [Limibacillus halophilus]MBB3066650.1 integrase [Limibacillus halophilus]
MASIQKRVSSKGKISYRAVVRVKGAPTQTATFLRKTDAVKWAHDKEYQIRYGKHFPTSHAKRVTVAKAIDRYIEEVLPHKPRSLETQRQQLLWWKSEIGSRVLADVRPEVLVETRGKLLSKPSRSVGTLAPSSVNRYMSALRHVFAVAIREWRWIESSPFSALKKLPEPDGRVRYLRKDEAFSLLKACKESKSSVLYPLVVLALSTGARKMELLSLPWDDFDVDKGQIVFQKTKSGRRRSVPVTGKALTILRDLWNERCNGEPYVFTNGKGGHVQDIKLAWQGALARACIEDFRFHDLRHTAASYLAMSGATAFEIAEILGHSTLEMTKRYAHLSPSHLSKVVAGMNASLLGELELDG